MFLSLQEIGDKSSQHFREICTDLLKIVIFFLSNMKIRTQLLVAEKFPNFHIGTLTHVVARTKYGMKA